MAKQSTFAPPLSLRSAADLSGKQWLLGKIGAGGVNVCTVLGEPVDGIIGGYQNNKGGAGDYIDVRGPHQADGMALSGAAIADGAELTTDANAKLVTAVAGNTVFAKAQSVANAADQFVEFVFVPRYVKA